MLGIVQRRQMRDLFCVGVSRPFCALRPHPVRAKEKHRTSSVSPFFLCFCLPDDGRSQGVAGVAAETSRPVPYQGDTGAHLFVVFRRRANQRPRDVHRLVVSSPHHAEQHPQVSAAVVFVGRCGATSRYRRSPELCLRGVMLGFLLICQLSAHTAPTNYFVCSSFRLKDRRHLAWLMRTVFAMHFLHFFFSNVVRTISRKTSRRPRR